MRYLKLSEDLSMRRVIECVEKKADGLIDINNK